MALARVGARVSIYGEYRQQERDEEYLLRDHRRDGAGQDILPISTIQQAVGEHCEQSTETVVQ